MNEIPEPSINQQLALIDMILDSEYSGSAGSKYITSGGLSTLEAAFESLNLSNPILKSDLEKIYTKIYRENEPKN